MTLPEKYAVACKEYWDGEKDHIKLAVRWKVDHVHLKRILKGRR